MLMAILLISKMRKSTSYVSVQEPAQAVRGEEGFDLCLFFFLYANCKNSSSIDMIGGRIVYKAQMPKYIHSKLDRPDVHLYVNSHWNYSSAFIK